MILSRSAVCLRTVGATARSRLIARPAKTTTTGTIRNTTAVMRVIIMRIVTMNTTITTATANTLATTTAVIRITTTRIVIMNTKIMTTAANTLATATAIMRSLLIDSSHQFGLSLVYSRVPLLPMSATSQYLPVPVLMTTLVPFRILGLATAMLRSTAATPSTAMISTTSIVAILMSPITITMFRTILNPLMAIHTKTMKMSTWSTIGTIWAMI